MNFKCFSGCKSIHFVVWYTGQHKDYQESEDEKVRWQDKIKTAIVNIIIILCVGSNHVKLYNNIIAMIHVKAW